MGHAPITRPELNVVELEMGYPWGPGGTLSTSPSRYCVNQCGNPVCLCVRLCSRVFASQKTTNKLQGTCGMRSTGTWSPSTPPYALCTPVVPLLHRTPYAPPLSLYSTVRPMHPRCPSTPPYALCTPIVPLLHCTPYAPPLSLYSTVRPMHPHCPSTPTYALLHRTPTPPFEPTLS